MSCITGNIGDLYFVRWLEPSPEDVDGILAGVRDAHNKRGKIHYVAVVGEHIPPPSEEVRTAMKKTIDALFDWCATVHLVIEGRGFRRAMARSVGTSIFLLSRNRGRAFAHDSVEDALERIGLEPDARGEVLGEARNRKLLNEVSAAPD